MKSIFASGLLFTILFFASCQNNGDHQKAELTQAGTTEQNNDAEQQIPIGENQQPPNDADTAGTQQPPHVSPGPTTPTVDWDKKIIKTATLKYEVSSAEKYNAMLRGQLTKYGAYIAQEDNYQYNDRQEIALIIKVPVDRFELLVNDLKGKDAIQVERTIRAEDVTAQVIDTKSRLQTKRQMREKYLDFLKQAKNIEEVLKVQAEINSLQEEIESAEGRLKYLGNQAAYSTINLSFYQPNNGFSYRQDDGSFWYRAGKALTRGGQLIQGLIIITISIWPLLLLALLGLIFFKYKKRTRLIKENARTKIN